MPSPVQNWLNQMKAIWLEKRPDDIGALLSDKGFVYNEHPFHDPLITKNDVISAWQDIKHQDIDYVTMNVLYETNNIGVAEWHFKMKDEPLHIGSYYLELDDDGLCTHFRQWWTVE